MTGRHVNNTQLRITKMKKKTQRPLSKKTKQVLEEIKTVLHEELCKALEGRYIVQPNLLVPYESHQKYRYITDSSQFPLEGARVSSIELGKGLPTITVKKTFELAYDGGLDGDHYRDITVEVALYTLPIYKRVVVVYATNKLKDATCFETFCQQQGIKYIKLDKPFNNRKKTIQQMIGAMNAMGKLYRTNHTKKGTKQCNT